MNPQQFNILVVDDEADITGLLQEILEDEGYRVSVAEDAAAADKIYLNQSIDLVLLDIWMPKEDGLSLLTRWCEDGLKSQVIMMSGHGTIETAVQATKLGAYDFIEKPISMAKLMISVEHVFNKIKLEQRHKALMKQMNPDIQIIGKSAIINQLKNQLEQIANKALPVCFLGRPGVGKNYYARYLHQLAGHRQEPFIVVNASSLTREQQLDAIFGRPDKDGLLQLAESGALYVDELADLEPETQALFAQLIEHGHYRRPGEQALISPKVRLFFASQYALTELLEAGTLQANLYYAIQTLLIQIPELQLYQDDIPEIISHYLYHFVDYEDLPYRQFSMPALNLLRQYQWPGNVRELRNFIQRALVMATGDTISLEETEALLKIGEAQQADESLVSIDLPIREARERFEKAYFVKQLGYCDGNIAKLAERAGLERTNLYRKLKSLGIQYK
ncbi:MAG: transcriptional regulator [Gammaproteobacteria bacterium]|nr:MAG: transcriptional regulator [Gammaproteobacteria bacterium]